MPEPRRNNTDRDRDEGGRPPRLPGTSQRPAAPDPRGVSEMVPRRDGAVTLAQLNSSISSAPTTQALLRLFGEHGARMDGRHLALLWPRLGKRAAGEVGRGAAQLGAWVAAHEAALRQLVRQSVEELRRCSPKDASCF